MPKEETKIGGYLILRKRFENLGRCTFCHLAVSSVAFTNCRHVKEARAAVLMQYKAVVPSCGGRDQ